MGLSTRVGILWILNHRKSVLIQTHLYSCVITVVPEITYFTALISFLKFEPSLYEVLAGTLKVITVPVKPYKHYCETAVMLESSWRFPRLFCCVFIVYLWFYKNWTTFPYLKWGVLGGACTRRKRCAGTGWIWLAGIECGRIFLQSPSKFSRHSLWNLSNRDMWYTVHPTETRKI